jgi:hypothetical protein
VPSDGRRVEEEAAPVARTSLAETSKARTALKRMALVPKPPAVRAAVGRTERQAPPAGESAHPGSRE